MTTIPATDAAVSTEPVLFWRSQDGQREIEIDGIASDAIEFLLGECSNDEERTAILAGSVEIAPPCFVAFDAFPNAADPSHLDRTQRWPAPIQAETLSQALAIAVRNAADTYAVVVVELDRDGDEVDSASAVVA